MHNSSILTFNCSVLDKENLTAISSPFQIMPGTIRHIRASDFPKFTNPNILVHLNYITRPFSKLAIEKGSMTRYGLKCYKELSIKDILVHGPASEEEWDNLGTGFKVLKDEIGEYIHFEIPTFTGTFKSQSPPIITYLDTLLEYSPEAFLIPDTAHLYANGVDGEEMIEIIEKYKDRIKYIHFNGNLSPMGKQDRHTPMFYDNNKIKEISKLSKYIASLNKICIVENRVGEDWDKWVDYSVEYGFKLVEYNRGFL